MPDYSKGCIYKIKRNDDYDDENIYIGSTCNFTKRKCDHKYNCCVPNSRDYNYPLYKYIRDNGGWEYFIMIRVHDYSCNNKYELEVEERRVIDELEAKLNSYIPTRTKKERYDNDEEYRSHKLAVCKQFYIDNKEECNKKGRERYNANKHIINAPIECDNCGRVVVNSVLNRHKKSNYCFNHKKNN